MSKDGFEWRWNDVFGVAWIGVLALMRGESGG
jgi:hypothetical protein